MRRPQKIGWPSWITSAGHVVTLSQPGTMSVGRAAWPGDLGQTGSLALRMSEALATGGHFQHVHVFAEQLKLGRTALAAGPDDADDHIGDPQQWLGGSGYVVDTEVTAFGQGEPGALGCRDVWALRSAAGLDEQVLHLESMQRSPISAVRHAARARS
jgi:hypothetical protein